MSNRNYDKLTLKDFFSLVDKHTKIKDDENLKGERSKIITVDTYTLVRQIIDESGWQPEEFYDFKSYELENEKG